MFESYRGKQNSGVGALIPFIGFILFLTLLGFSSDTIAQETERIPPNANQSGTESKDSLTLVKLDSILRIVGDSTLSKHLDTLWREGEAQYWDPILQALLLPPPVVQPAEYNFLRSIEERNNYVNPVLKLKAKVNSGIIAGNTRIKVSGVGQAEKPPKETSPNTAIITKEYNNCPQDIFLNYQEGPKPRYVVYDLNIKTPYLIKVNKNTGCKKTSRLTSWANRPTGLVILNANPTLHQVEVKRIRYNNDRFKISESLLQNVAGKKAPETNNSNSAAETGNDADQERAELAMSLQIQRHIDNGAALDGIKMFEQLADQLEEYRNSLMNSSEWNEARFRADWNFLNKQLKKYTDTTFQTGYDLKLYGSSGLGDATPQSIAVPHLKNVNRAARLYDELRQLQFHKVYDGNAPGHYDQLQFEVKITEGEKTVIRGEDHAPITVRISGGLRVDGSAGLFVTDLRDFSYTTINEKVLDTSFYRKPDFTFTDSILAIDTITKRRIEEKEIGDIQVSLGALIHFYWRSSGYFNGGISVGTLINSDARLRYLAGGSLLMGRVNRFVLNAGIAIGQVSRLRSDLRVEGYYQEEGNVPTEDVWGTGWYVGLTYNF